MAGVLAISQSAPVAAADIVTEPFASHSTEFELRDELERYVHELTYLCGLLAEELVAAAPSGDESDRIRAEHYSWTLGRDAACRDLARGEGGRFTELECLAVRTEERWAELDALVHPPEVEEPTQRPSWRILEPEEVSDPVRDWLNAASEEKIDALVGGATSDEPLRDRNASLMVARTPPPGWSYSTPVYSEGACDLSAVCDALGSDAAGIQVTFSISKTGVVLDSKLRGECASTVDVSPVLESLQGWRFNPAIFNGKAVGEPYACVLFRFDPVSEEEEET